MTPPIRLRGFTLDASGRINNAATPLSINRPVTFVPRVGEVVWFTGPERWRVLAVETAYTKDFDMVDLFVEKA